jgi:putative nucleotidyltransferase with HDIG domain
VEGDDVLAERAGHATDRRALRRRRIRDRDMNRLCIITDSVDAAAEIGGQLAGFFETHHAGSRDNAHVALGAHVIIDVDLADGPKVSALGQTLRRRPTGGKVIAVVERGARRQAVQAFAIGATDVISRPIDQAALLAKLMPGTQALAGAASTVPPSTADTVLAGIGVLHDAFTAASAGAPIDPQSTATAGHAIVSHLKADGLACWIDTVRLYHGQTYQHCLLVTGVAVAFGQSLGFGAADQHNLALAGLFHDVGKAKIPLAILEKPGPLDDHEMSIMRQHPMLGLDVLRNVPELSPSMLDVVARHHEYLDGSGYPHGLRGNEISDLVRVITIADVFGALIERRSYKPAMSRQAAYDILKGMGGKLDHDLVREFSRIVDAPG